jgi:acyl-ACP thioesterase
MDAGGGTHGVSPLPERPQTSPPALPTVRSRPVDTSIPVPARGRSFSSQRRVRLSDLDEHGRVRLDAIARFLQDVAIDDVTETGWGMPDHLWFVRCVRLDVISPFVADREVELTTWCSGMAAIAAGRRWSVRGDEGGRIEVDSVWIHLGPDQRPVRLEQFGVYADATAGRRVSTRLELPDPPTGARRRPFPLRVADVDLHGHVNNAVYWQAVEEALDRNSLPASGTIRASLDFRHPIDLGDALELAETDEGGVLGVGFVTAGGVRAVARIESLPATSAEHG